VYIDNTPPTLLIDSPKSNQVISGTLTISADAIGSVEPPTVVLSDSIRLTSSFLETSGLEEGRHWLTFKACDQAQNTAEKQISFIVDRSPPEILSLGVESGDLVSGLLELNPCLDEANPKSFIWYFDGEAMSDQPICRFDTAEYPDGYYSIGLEVIDAVGLKAEKTILIAIDNTPPIVVWYPNRDKPFYLPSRVKIQMSPDDLTKTRETRSGNEVDLPLATTEPDFQVRYFVNEEPSESIIDLGNYEPGSLLELKVEVADPAGNKDHAAVTIEVEQSVRANLNIFGINAPGVIPGGATKPDPLPISFALISSFAIPALNGIAIDENYWPVRIGLALGTPLGYMWLTGIAPPKIDLGLAAKFRFPGFLLAGIQGSLVHPELSIGVSPLLSNTIHSPDSESPPDELPIDLEKTHRSWARLGLSIPIIPINAGAPRFNVWFSLGAEFASSEHRSYAIHWSEGVFDYAEQTNLVRRSRMALYFGFDLVFHVAPTK